MKLSKLASNICYFFLKSNYPKIIICSSGRSGSTMLFKAVTDGIIVNKFGQTNLKLFGRKIRQLISTFIREFSQINDSNFLVYKSHAPFSLDGKIDLTNCLILFVYCDPLDAAISVEEVVKKRGIEWFYEHQKNLYGKGSYEDLFTKDILNYENTIKSWLDVNEENILCIDYIDLWKNENIISNFLGFKVSLAQKFERTAKNNKRKVNHDLFEHLKKKKNYLKRNYLSSHNVER